MSARDTGLVGDRFKVLRLLGEGGFGTVHLAIHQELGREVALKILRREVLGDPDLVARFLREARMVARLAHQNIVRVIDCGEDGGQPWIAFEYVNGPTLAERLAQGRLTPANAIRAASEIAGALAAAHAQQVLHRDVKPQNVLCDESGACRLTDFGVARWTTTRTIQTQAGMLLGTPTYLAPEYIRSGAFTAQGDLYALGVMLWETLVGRPPFGGDSLHALLSAHLNEPPTPPGRFVEVPPELDRVVLGLLEKEPERRFATADAVVRELEALTAIAEEEPARPLRASGASGASSTVRIPRINTRSGSISRSGMAGAHMLSGRVGVPVSEQTIAWRGRAAVGVVVALTVLIALRVTRSGPTVTVLPASAIAASSASATPDAPAPIPVVLAEANTALELELKRAEEVERRAATRGGSEWYLSRRIDPDERKILLGYTDAVCRALSAGDRAGARGPAWLLLVQHFIRARNGLGWFDGDADAKAAAARLVKAAELSAAASSSRDPCRLALAALGRRSSIEADTRPRDFLQRADLAQQAAALVEEAAEEGGWHANEIETAARLAHEGAIDCVRGWNMVFLELEVQPALSARLTTQLAASLKVGERALPLVAGPAPPEALFLCGMHCLRTTVEVLSCRSVASHLRPRALAQAERWVNALAALPRSKRPTGAAELLARLDVVAPEAAHWAGHAGLAERKRP